MRWALVVLLLAVAAADDEVEEEVDDQPDEAPFMVVVSDARGARRAGVLVSARTCITCGACARGEGLRVRAAGGEERRVLRVFEPRGGGGGPALLELEEPLPVSAHVGPIMMARAAEDCAVGAACHLVRVWRRGALRLRIVDALLQPPRACRAVPAAAADLCLAGPLLCESDRGTGVVCGGQLCGVLTRSAAGDAGADSDDDGGGGGDGEACGTLHAAHSLVRHRKFIHCAHKLSNCGRGDCAEVCTERRLLDAREPPTRAPPDVTSRRTSTTQLINGTTAPPAPQRLSSPPLPPSRVTTDLTTTDLTTTDLTTTAIATARSSIARPSIEWVEAQDYIENGDERQPPPSVSPSSTSQSPRTSPPPRQSPRALAAAAPADNGPSQDSVPLKECFQLSRPVSNSAHSTSHAPRNILSLIALLLMVFNTAR